MTPMTPSKHRRAMLAKETDPEWKIIAKAETDAAFEPEADAIIEQRAAEIRPASILPGVSPCATSRRAR